MNLQQIMKLTSADAYSPAAELMVLVNRTVGAELRRLRDDNDALEQRVYELEHRARTRRMITRTRTSVTYEQVTERYEEE